MKYFLIFSNCTLTIGATRTVISDLQENKLFFIPNELYDILIELKNTPLIQVKNKLDVDTQETLMEYINYFIDEGIGFFTDSPERFPDFPLEFETPEIINNGIIDLGKESTYDIKKVINNLTDVQCKYLEVRVYTTISIDKIEEIVLHCSKGYFKNIDFIAQYSKDENYVEQVKAIVLKSPLIGRVLLHSAPSDYEDDFIKQTKAVILNNTCCGVINQSYFVSSIPVFTEAQHQNTCLNKKISVDVKGNIKNCPSMSKDFGNIKNTSLKKALALKEFKKHWNISKDHINICKDCEFRYICTDCRAFTENPNDEFSKPLKCGYSPYTNEWKDWSTNPLKVEAIKSYGMSYLINSND